METKDGKLLPRTQIIVNLVELTRKTENASIRVVSVIIETLLSNIY